MPTRTQRGQGQWALGYHEPLNPSERIKKDDAGLNVRQRILTRYAQLGFDAIDPSDLRGRFRWWGLYTQRRPGIGGGRTGTLDDAEIEDSYFMMRVRIPGGQLTSDQTRAVAGVAKEYGRDLADITDRQNVQFHWIRIEDVPAIWKRLEAVGLSSVQACGDVPRNILGCPVAGIDAAEVLDGTAALRATEAVAAGNPAFANLPRKYKTAISGCAAHCSAPEINDVSFVGVTGPDGTAGYDLWVGGGLSTNPMLAQRLGVFVAPDRVPQVWEGVTGLFRDHGYRRLRSRARLKFLVADWGVARFREVLEARYLHAPLPDGPPAPDPVGPRDHLGVNRQADGRHYVGMAPNVGRLTGTALWEVADLAEEHGSGRLRTTAEQKLLILDVPEDHVAELVGELEARDLRVNPSAFRRSAMACTGIEFCKLAIVETKQRAVDLCAELDRQLPGFDTPVNIHVNGCPNSCARFQVADIGLKGSIVDGGEGFQVHLGGALGADPGFGRKLRGLKVTADGLADYVERLLRNYLADRADGEQFAAARTGRTTGPGRAVPAPAPSGCGRRPTRGRHPGDAPRCRPQIRGGGHRRCSPAARRAGPMTRLLLAAHGSRDPAAQRSAALVARQVAALTGVATSASFVQHVAPSVADALAHAAAAAPPGGVVLVPLLLAGGYHLAEDLRPAAALAGARITAPLGPDALPAEALAGRLAEAGVPAGTPVVLAAAGSSHHAAAADTRRQAALLARRWSAPVRAAYAAAAAPSVEEAVAEFAGPAGRPVAIASCLLAPGVFHTRLRSAGAAWVTAPLGGHPAVARLVAQRFHAAGRPPPASPAGLVTGPASSLHGWPRSRAGHRSGARPSGTCRR